MRTYTQWHLHILLGCAIHRCVLLGCSCVSAELVHQGRGSKREGGSVTRKRGMREGQMDRERQRETKKRKRNAIVSKALRREREGRWRQIRSETLRRCKYRLTNTHHRWSCGEMKVCPHLSLSRSCQDKTIMVGV